MVTNITSKQALIDKEITLADTHDKDPQNNKSELLNNIPSVNQLPEQLSILSDQSKQIIVECIEDIKLLQARTISKDMDDFSCDNNNEAL